MILAWLSAGFVAGVVAGAWAPAPTGLLLLLAALFAAGALLCRRSRWSSGLLLLAAFALGLSRAPTSHSPSPDQLSYYNGRRVTLDGVVAAEPDMRDTGINYVVAARHITVGGQTKAVSGQAQVHTPRSQQLEYGDQVSLTGRLTTPRNTGAAPYRDIFARRGIYSEMRFPRLADLGATDRGWLGWIVPLRQRLEDGIDAWLPEPESALLIAITLGAKSASLGHLTPVLVKTGLIHIIAISGIKVALVAGMLFWTAGLLRRRLVALLLSLAGLLLYLLLTGATESGERSALMWAVVFLAWYLGRGTVALVSLALVSAAMVAITPSLPWDIGFQLSVVGTFSIIAFTEPLLHLCPAIPLPPRKALVVVVIPSPLREALCVTISAQIGTLPIVAVGWHLVSAMGPVANGLVLPVLPALIVLGFALGAVSSLGALAAPIAALAYVLLHGVVVVATLLATLPGAVPAGAVSPAFSAVYYLALAAAAWLLLHRANWTPIGRYPSRAREFVAAALIVASTLTFSLSHAEAQPRARLYWLGSGDALLIRSGGRTALIDGSARPFDLLERMAQALPFRARTIDVLIVTDPRAGNLTGLQAALRHYRVSEVLDVGAEYPSTTYARWRADLRRRRVPVYALRTGASVRIGAVGLVAIGPDDLYPNARDCIGLLRLSVAGRTVLLAGESSEREQREALFRPVKLAAGTLLIDARRGYDPAFLHAVHPRVLLTRGRLLDPLRVERLKDGQEMTFDL